MVSKKVQSILEELNNFRWYPHLESQKLIDEINSLSLGELAEKVPKRNFGIGLTSLFLDVSNAEEASLLEYAALENNPSAVKLLLEKGNYSKEEIKNALEIARIHKNRRDVGSTLYSAGNMFNYAYRLVEWENPIPRLNTSKFQPDPKYDMVSLLENALRKDKTKSINPNRTSQPVSIKTPLDKKAFTPRLYNEDLIKEIKTSKTIEEAEHIYKNQPAQPFTVHSSKTDEHGNTTIVYNDPRYDPCPEDKQVTYIVGKDGKLQSVKTGKSADCMLPPMKTEDGFQCIKINNGDPELVHAIGTGKNEVVIEKDTVGKTPRKTLERHSGRLNYQNEARVKFRERSLSI